MSKISVPAIVIELSRFTLTQQLQTSSRPSAPTSMGQCPPEVKFRLMSKRRTHSPIKRKRPTLEQIIHNLRTAEQLITQGQNAADVCRA